MGKTTVAEKDRLDLKALTKSCFSSNYSSTLLQLLVLRLGLFQDGDVGVGPTQCGLVSLAKILFWHSFVADSNSPNSGVRRNFTSNGSVCKPV